MWKYSKEEGASTHLLLSQTYCFDSTHHFYCWCLDFLWITIFIFLASCWLKPSTPVPSGFQFLPFAICSWPQLSFSTLSSCHWIQFSTLVLGFNPRLQFSVLGSSPWFQVSTLVLGCRSRLQSSVPVPSHRLQLSTPVLNAIFSASPQL